MKIQKAHKLSGWEVKFYTHSSVSTGTDMNFSVFLPKDISEIDSAIIWLSGLTCTEENFMAKSGIWACLSGTSTMIICPDTSPRGLDLPLEHDSYDFWSGAGFYLNATTKWYNDHYNMYNYVNEEIHTLLLEEFKISKDKISLMWHSMGWHWALTIWLKNPQKYQSLSAFSPIVNPTECPWGQKAFAGYLWSDTESWKAYDACELIKSGYSHTKPILIDQGTIDEFLEKELLTDNFKIVCEENNLELELNFRDGYDHSYYFISSFLKNHIVFHLTHLK